MDHSWEVIFVRRYTTILFLALLPLALPGTEAVTFHDEQCSQIPADAARNHHSLLQRGWRAAVTHTSQRTSEGAQSNDTSSTAVPGVVALSQTASQKSRRRKTILIDAGETVQASGMERAMERYLGSSFFIHSNDLGREVCGTRPLFPQLQFELEVYRAVGLVKSQYSRCRVPSARSVTQHVVGGGIASGVDSLYTSLDSLMESNWHHVKERRALIAQAVAATFCAWTILAILNHLYGIRQEEKGRLEEQQSKIDCEMLQSVWKAGSSRWMGMSLEWLEPVIGRYGWGGKMMTKSVESSDESAGEAHHDSYIAFRRVWQDEVKVHGLENANLLRAVRNFIGFRVMCWLVFTAGVACLLELAAMTVVLDMLLNYLHLARAAREINPDISLDLLQPTLMFIVLGFGVPMVARVFHNMTALSDTFHTNRITAGMLTIIYEKSQHLPFYDDRDGKRQDPGELVQILTNDIRSMWRGTLTSAANLVIQPICAAFLIIFLVRHLGRAALFGAVSTFWIGFVYFPIQKHVSLGHARWGQLATSRVGLLKEALLNVKTIKAAVWDQPLSERIYSLREAELQTKFRFSLVQSLLDVPFNLFPFALVVSSLFFSYIIRGNVQPQEIFACMQALSGLAYCSPPFVAALQKSLSVPNVAKLVERFLLSPEKDVKTMQRREGSSMNYVRVRGSFAVAEGQRPVLRDVDFTARRGELVAVVGEVASGKSALLAAILGELPGADSDALVEAPQNPVFCSQVPWVVDGTLKENVLLGEPQNQDRLYDALDSASLLKDVLSSDAPVKERSLEASRAQVEAAGVRTVAEEEVASKNSFPYFGVWNFCAVVVFVFSVSNVNWQMTRPALGLLTAAIQGLLHWSVLEFPIQTVATLMTTTRKLAKADCSHITCTLNYNLLATSQADVDECMHNMLEAYLNNMHENVSAVLVSATNDPNLQQYELQVRNDHRARVYKELFRSGLAWAGFVEGGEVKQDWRERVWAKYEHLDKNEFVQRHLNGICERYAREYMVLHRQTRVLRKCGQYQDLILLSAGEDLAFTYCDTELYGRAARKEGEPLFKASEDTENVRGRHFDYTLVLDSDTRVEPGSVFKVLEVAAAYPEKAIVQPAIKMDCGPEDSIFMHLEAMRQRVYEPMNSTMTTLLGKSSFFGKGLVKNQAYAKYCLGTRDRLIESVPIDVLSHDTFEAAVTNPLYCNSVYLLEAPCHNYITWDIRERRWNLGELLLAMYFWPNGVGKPVQWLQSKFQGNKFNRIQVRTKTKLDKVSSYFAHSALRQMVLKPMLLAYIVVMHFVEMRWKWTPFVGVMFAIIVFPKFATCNRNNYKDVLLETGASILQFTPEAIVGTIRVLSAVSAHLAGAATWVPQRAVEEESKVSNPFVFSIRYLWYYSAFALVWGFRVGLWAASVGPDAMFIITILGTLFMLPLYVGFTSLPANALRSIASGRTRDVAEKDEAEGGKIADAADASLQALRVRLPKMRIRQLQTSNLVNNPQRQQAALHVSQAANLAIGARGARLSNGDRARIGLARAAYSKRSNLVLIDDPFTLVDVPTGMHILHKLLKGPMMHGRTRIVAMQPYLDYLEHFDRVIVLQEGRVVADGAPLDIQSVREFQELLAKTASDQSLEALQTTKPFVTMNPGDSPFQLSEHGADRVADEEIQGPPQWGKLWAIILKCGVGRLMVAVMSVVVLRLMAQGQMILLGRWADQAQELQEVGGTYYIMITVVVIIFSLFQVLQGYSVLAFNNNTSRHIFRSAFSTLLKAPIDAYWDKQPVGRVIGRLSGDVATVDVALSDGCIALASILVDVAVQQAFCIIVMPVWLIVPTNVIIFAFCRLFCNTAIQMQLLSVLALSRCQEDQAQLSASRLSIHAYQHEAKMVSQYSAHAGSVVTPDSVASYAKVWVITRITFCLCFQSTLCVLVGIMQPERIGMGSLAVLMAATFHILQQLNGLMDCLVNTFSVAISLQRLSDLNELPQDPPEQLSGDEQKRDRLVQDGIAVRFEGLRVGFGEGPDVLTNINVDIQARTKVVLAGGPGCGKTTVLHCVLRLLEPRAGRVLFNGTETRNLGLHTLRSMIGFVPQEPAIFAGTVRFNIDPFGQYPDERIWAAIQCAQLLPTVRRFLRGLDHVLAEDGSNLSFGQKQLLSLARAVCQQPPLLLLDECCTSLDPRTQEAVQDTIMLNFPNSTIIAATRRMDEIANFNHIVLFEKGTVVRQGPVSRLLEGRIQAPSPLPP